MKFKRNLQQQFGLGPLVITPLIDVVLLLLFYFMLTTPFAVQAGMNVQLPRTVTSDILRDENQIITISSENVLYFNNRVVTIQELKQQLTENNASRRPLLIKSDRRASVGRVVEIWNLCRELGIERINIATNQIN